MTAAAVATGQQHVDIVAGPGQEFRLRWAAVGVLAIAMGVWFAYDGWVKYPEHNRRHLAAQEQLRHADARKDPDAAAKATRVLEAIGEAHTDFDIALQKKLAIACPLLGIAILGHMLFHSRGTYRLTDTHLHIPGRGAIDRNTIRSIDMGRWLRKGIAIVTYDGGAAKLDDWHYERRATGEIVKRVCIQVGAKYLEPPAHPEP
jgi:hypothetical protein